MIKAIKIFQLDSIEVSVLIDANEEKFKKELLQDGYEFNENTGYYEKENEMVLIEEVEE